jgi:hypothetical protein
MEDSPSVTPGPDQAALAHPTRTVPIAITVLLTDLPAETLTNIMQKCPDIKCVLRLASTNRFMQQVWHLNTIIFSCAVLKLTKSELFTALELSKIEASTPGQPLQPAAQENDVNAAVRHYLFWIARLASTVEAVYQYHIADQLEANSCRKVAVTEEAEGL